MNPAFLTQHPYPLVKILDDPDNKSYFITHTGQRYELYFFPAEHHFYGTSYAANTWEFGFYPIEPLTQQMRKAQGIQLDPMISFTIMHSMLEHLVPVNNVLFFACDTHDSREAFRHRLFDVWYIGFKKYVSQLLGVEVIKLNSEFGSVKISVLYRHDNAFKEEIEASLSVELDVAYNNKYQ